MMPFKRFLAIPDLAACINLLSQCALKTVRPLTGSDAAATTASEKVAEIKRLFTEARMEQGKELFGNHCGRCHKLRMPATRNACPG